jgi:hypothetical protein
MTSDGSDFETVQRDLKALSAAARSLDSASDELTEVVGVLEEVFRKLNLDLTVWIEFDAVGPESRKFDGDRIGYAKVNDRWGIVLQQFGADNSWDFKEAPREMRIRSVNTIPRLIDALGKAAAKMAENLQEKTRDLRDFAAKLNR